jgi:hypothetical protein
MDRYNNREDIHCTKQGVGPEGACKVLEVYPGSTCLKAILFSINTV